MLIEEAQYWVRQGPCRQLVLLSLTQPLTVQQVQMRTMFSTKSCSRSLRELSLAGLVTCLNPEASSCRVYWPTPAGLTCLNGLTDVSTNDPSEFSSLVDWRVYAELCYRHRRAVMKAMDGPMQPSQIARTARLQAPRPRMSANNVRDVIRALKALGVVREVRVPKKAHPRYELTEVGRRYQDLLFRAETRPCHLS